MTDVLGWVTDVLGFTIATIGTVDVTAGLILATSMIFGLAARSASRLKKFG